MIEVPTPPKSKTSLRLSVTRFKRRSCFVGVGNTRSGRKSGNAVPIRSSTEDAAPSVWIVWTWRPGSIRASVTSVLRSELSSSSSAPADHPSTVVERTGSPEWRRHPPRWIQRRAR